MSLSADRPLRRWIQPGCTVALADGAGIPASVCGALSAAARAAGDVRLILGWCIDLPAGLDLTAFGDVRTFMAGYALAGPARAGLVHYVPAPLSQLPALLAGVWRPDVLVMSGRQTEHGLEFGTEVSWMAAAARQAKACLVEINHGLPRAARSGLPGDVEFTVISEVDRAPVQFPRADVDAVSARVGREVAAIIPAGATVQFGPGVIGEALITQLQVPVRVDSGVVTDAVVDLDERGLMLPEPLGAYLVGTERLYRWADRRPLLAGIDVTHDCSRLTANGLFAVNTALQVDLCGQVGIEEAGGRMISGIGGHADYARAASRAADGLSIVALPTRRRGQLTLVDRLAVSTSTARSEVDMIVTELGRADLRGLSDAERGQAIRAIYP